MKPSVLIACIGNIFLGDDGFGTEVARRLAERTLPPHVLVRDFGIRGLDLTWALLEPYELVILVDACQRGGSPGTLYLLEPDLFDLNAPDATPASLETHGMNPMNVLRVVQSLGGAPGRLLIVGCEPADIGDEDDGGKLGLSDAVQAVIDEAIELIVSRIPEPSEINEPAMQLN